MAARFHRLDERHRPRLSFFCDGVEIAALAGDTILTAILAHGGVLRHSDFSGAGRAGFCLMGACQDCLIWTIDGDKLRACSTPVSAGLVLLTRPPEASWPTPIS